MSVPSAAFRVPNAMATADGRPAAAAAATGTTAPAASAINANSFSLDLMQVAVTSLLHTAGFDRANLSATVVLADVAAFYLEDLARRASRFAEHQRRTDATFEDVVLALVDAHVDLMSFREYGAFVASSEKTQANDESAGVAQQLDGASATENAGGSVPSHDTANNYLSGPRPGPFPRPRPGMIPLKPAFLKESGSKWGDCILRGRNTANREEEPEIYRPRRGHELYIGHLPRFPTDADIEDRGEDEADRLAQQKALRMGITRDEDVGEGNRSDRRRTRVANDRPQISKKARVYFEAETSRGLDLGLHDLREYVRSSNLEVPRPPSPAKEDSGLTQPVIEPGDLRLPKPLLPNSAVRRLFQKIGKDHYANIPPPDSVFGFPEAASLVDELATAGMSNLRNLLHTSPTTKSKNAERVSPPPSLAPPSFPPPPIPPAAAASAPLATLHSAPPTQLPATPAPPNVELAAKATHTQQSADDPHPLAPTHGNVIPSPVTIIPVNGATGDFLFANSYAAETAPLPKKAIQESAPVPSAHLIPATTAKTASSHLRAEVVPLAVKSEPSPPPLPAASAKPPRPAPSKIKLKISLKPSSLKQEQKAPGGLTSSNSKLESSKSSSHSKISTISSGTADTRKSSAHGSSVSNGKSNGGSSSTAQSPLHRGPPSPSPPFTRPPTPPFTHSQPPPAESEPADIINCVCAHPDIDNGLFMIACDECGVWFHGACVYVSVAPDQWICKRCLGRG